MKKVLFLGQLCTLEFNNYQKGGAVSIQLVCDDGSPMATATVNLGNPPPVGHVFIKDYSENTGMVKALVDACIVEDTGEMVGAGNLCKLLVNV